MKNKLAMVLMSLFPAAAFASERNDSGMTLVYGFLFMCGMIIFLQCIPLIIMIWGLVKGMTQKALFKQHEK